MQQVSFSRLPGRYVLLLCWHDVFLRCYHIPLSQNVAPLLHPSNLQLCALMSPAVWIGDVSETSIAKVSVFLVFFLFFFHIFFHVFGRPFTLGSWVDPTFAHILTFCFGLLLSYIFSCHFSGWTQRVASFNRRSSFSHLLPHRLHLSRRSPASSYLLHSDSSNSKRPRMAASYRRPT